MWQLNFCIWIHGQTGKRATVSFIFLWQQLYDSKRRKHIFTSSACAEIIPKLYFGSRKRGWIAAKRPVLHSLPGETKRWRVKLQWHHAGSNFNLTFSELAQRRVSGLRIVFTQTTEYTPDERTTNTGIKCFVLISWRGLLHVGCTNRPLAQAVITQTRE